MVKARGTIIHSNNGTTDGHISKRRHFSAGSIFWTGASNSSVRAEGGGLTLMLVSLYRLANSFSALKSHGMSLSYADSEPWSAGSPPPSSRSRGAMEDKCEADSVGTMKSSAAAPILNAHGKT